MRLFLVKAVNTDNNEGFLVQAENTGRAKIVFEEAHQDSSGKYKGPTAGLSIKEVPFKNGVSRTIKSLT